MELGLGWIAIVAVGFALGFFGGGGGILTVPVLTYLFFVPASSATGYSLWIVGLSSAVGAAMAARLGHVEFRTGFVMAVPAMLTTFSVRRWLLPAIPSEIGSLGSVVITKDSLLMLLFAGLMGIVSYRMLRSKPVEEKEDATSSLPHIALIGVAVGLLAGLVGAGGGFLIVPALVLFANLPMKSAVGTSLLVIATQALVGFAGEASTRPIEWGWAFQLAGFAIAGLILGVAVGSRTKPEKLRLGFARFVAIMGALVLAKELITLFR